MRPEARKLLKTLERGDSAAEEANAFFISLSDLMILLCVFFIMMVSFSEVDIGSFEKVRSAFRGHTRNTLVELSNRLQDRVGSEPAIPGVQVRLANDGVRLDLDSAALFDVGSAVLKPGSLETLRPLLEIIKATAYRLDVEGHSDDQPFLRRRGDEIETNWSLSGRRASRVVYELLQVGFTPERLRIVGYADTRPKQSILGLSEDRLEAARAENRRVSILVR